jgi:cytochrome c oxidase cbb3-type subunit IV
MDINTMREAVTLTSFVVFVGIVLWAWSGANRQRFEEAAHLPFDEIEDVSEVGKDQQGNKGVRR